MPGKFESLIRWRLHDIAPVTKRADGLSKTPLRIDVSDIDKQLLRKAISAELDAISLYEQMAAACESPEVKTIMLDIALEEKTHVGEFMALLNISDLEQLDELDNGKKEVEEKT